MSKKIRLFRHTIPVIVLTLVLLIGGPLVLDRGYHHFMTKMYPLEYRQQVEAAGAQQDFAPSLIYAVIHTESHFNANAISPANAKGLMQLTDSTFQWAMRRAGESGRYDSDDLFNPDVNIRYGVYVLSLLREQFSSTATILAAYNAGQGRVREWLNDPALSSDGVHLDTIPYKETAEYIERVTKAQKRYQELYNIN